LDISTQDEPTTLIKETNHRLFEFRLPNDVPQSKAFNNEAVQAIVVKINGNKLNSTAELSNALRDCIVL